MHQHLHCTALYGTWYKSTAQRDTGVVPCMRPDGPEGRWGHEVLGEQ